MQLMLALRQFRKYFLLHLYTVGCMFFKSVGSKLASEDILTKSVWLASASNHRVFYGAHTLILPARLAFTTDKPIAK